MLELAPPLLAAALSGVSSNPSAYFITKKLPAVERAVGHILSVVLCFFPVPPRFPVSEIISDQRLLQISQPPKYRQEEIERRLASTRICTLARVDLGIIASR